MKITTGLLPDQSWTTELQKFQEQLSPHFASARQAHDILEQLTQNSSLIQAQEAMRQLGSSLRLHEQFTSAISGIQAKDMLHSASLAFESQKFLEQFAAKNTLKVSDELMRVVRGIDSLSSTAKQYAEVLKPLSQQNELFEKYRQLFTQTGASDLVKQMQSYGELAGLREAKSSFDNLFDRFGDFDLSQLSVDAESEREVSMAAHDITRQASEQQSFEDAIKRIVTAIHSQQNLTVQVMLWVIFCKVMDWLISGAIGAVMGHYAPTVLGNSPQAEKKAVQQIARAAVGSSAFLLEYRYVSAKVLVVRQKPKATSPEVGRLVFGRAVKLLKKEKDFALVQWSDNESGAEIQGWVFARYLEKFN